MYEHNAFGYWSGLALCLTKVRSSRARCPATALINPLDPVVQSIVSLTISLRHKFVKQISAKVTNTLLFFVEKM